MQAGVSARAYPSGPFFLHNLLLVISYSRLRFKLNISPARNEAHATLNMHTSVIKQDTLRQLSHLLNIPLWQFGLSEYNPFTPQDLPGRGEHLFQETLDTAEHLIQKTWYLRRIAPISEAEESAQYLSSLSQNFLTSQPPSSVLEPRSLRLYAQVQRLIGVMHVERKHYPEAIAAYSNMYNIAKQLDEPYFLT